MAVRERPSSPALQSGYSSDSLHTHERGSVTRTRRRISAANAITPAGGPAYAFTKRAFDIVFAATLLVATAPIWLAAAFLIRLTSRGPIVYGQTRCGRDGHLFTCYKFRTMIVGAHALREELRRQKQVRGPVVKLPDDPRVTGLGRWLRKSSIDELPQLINVLRGDMSIVGPRPAIPEEIAHYSRYQRSRLAVKPGLTGLWQVSGRCSIVFQRWIELDREYIQRRSFWLDVEIILRTIPAVLSGRGAF